MENKATNIPEKRKRLLRLCLIAACVFACLTLVTGCAYRWMASKALKKEITSAERNPNTGILKGAEPIALGTGDKGVLLLHGFIGSPMDFGELPQRLAKAGYRVYVPLLPGHGTTPEDMLHTDADDWLEGARKAYHDISEECDWVAVVGFSMGGTLAIRMASDDAERSPDALILACPFLGITYRWYAVLSPATWNRILSPFIPYVMRSDTFVQVKRREVAPAIVSYRVMPTRSATELVNAATVVRETVDHLPTDRTLLIYAPDDGAAAPKRILEMADKWDIPATSRVAIENSNHLVFWDYSCEIAMDAIIKHLDRFSRAENN